MARNVILIHADQMRADALGCSGNPVAVTPHLDGLAASGTRFTRHIAANPVCSPSRASLLTGLYPTGHGLWTNGVPLPRAEYQVHDPRFQDWSHIRIVPEPVTLADWLGAAGYDTAAIGKLHLTPSLSPATYGHPESDARWDTGANDAWSGPYYGFRHVELTHGHGEGPMRRGHYACWLAREHPEALPLLDAGGPASRLVPEVPDLFVSQVPSSLHHSAWIADRAISWLNHGRDPGRSFCLFLGFPDPHHPFTPCADVWPDFANRAVGPAIDPAGAGLQGNPGFMQNPFRVGHLPPESQTIIRRATAAMVHQIDCAVGRLLTALDRLELTQDTVVVFTSDHGDFLCDHGLLRKWVFASDVLLRVPFLLRAPGAGLPSVVDAPMSNVDVLPTLASLIGVAPPAHMQGRDMVAELRTGGEHPVFAMASIGRPESVNLTIYDQRFRYTCFPHAGFAELFDHAEDPGECRNRATDPALAGERRRLHTVLSEAMLNTWTPNVGCVAAW